MNNNPGISLRALAPREMPACLASTSIKRELAFLLSHTIHHYAIVAIICRLQGLSVEDDFGIAPSTLRHRAAQLKAPCGELNDFLAVF